MGRAPVKKGEHDADQQGAHTELAGPDPNWEEHLEARARVDQLLEKISREGIDALSRRERKFLQYASRFYPNGDRVTSEGQQQP